jgi:uncharacterized membrane protein YGL010W
MKSLTQQLRQYAAYHRDRRNVMTHFVGIPMIVLAATILLARPTFILGEWFISPALVIAAVLTLYYLKLDLRYGLVMGVLLTLSLVVAGDVADGDQASWLGWGVGLFVVGWIIQFVGHHYEGRKPAFLDDVMGLAIGPLFVVAEAGFLLGFRKEVEAQIQGGFSPASQGS